MDELLSGILGGLLGSRLVQRMTDRTADRLQAEGAVRSALRVLDGDVAGVRLPSVWRPGTARPAPGLIQFKGIRIEVKAIDAAATRQPTFRETWSSVDPDSRIIRVETDSATLEWAVPGRQFDWAVGEVMGR